MLLEGGLHDLSLVTDFPDTDFSLHTSRDNSLAVSSWSKGSYTVIVRVIDGVEETTRLREESSDLSITPSRENTLSISHEFHTEALEPWDFDTEELLSCGGIPDTNIVN